MTALLQVPRTTVWRAFIHPPARLLYRYLLLHACIHLTDLLLVLDLAVGLLGDADAAPIDRQASEVGLDFKTQNIKFL